MKLETIFRVSAPLRAAPVALRYLLATAIILLFFALRVAAAPYMGGFPFLLFFPAIILISALFDRGTGVFAVLLSAGMAWYFFVPTVHSFELPNLKDALPLALYVLIGLFLAVTVEALRSAAERLAKTSLALERANDFNNLLIEDINHRVKNHLASVNGLLHLSFREINDTDAQRRKGGDWPHRGFGQALQPPAPFQRSHRNLRAGLHLLDLRRPARRRYRRSPSRLAG